MSGHVHKASYNFFLLLSLLVLLLFLSICCALKYLSNKLLMARIILEMYKLKRSVVLSNKVAISRKKSEFVAERRETAADCNLVRSEREREW